MTFNSWEFLIFYPITLLLYFLLPKKWSRISLLFMSAIFYLAWNYGGFVFLRENNRKNGEKSRKKAVSCRDAYRLSRRAFLLQIL